jgi:hypothetical protein
MRNAALQLAETDTVLLLDVDCFLPANFPTDLPKNLINQLITTKSVLVLPAFENADGHSIRSYSSKAKVVPALFCPHPSSVSASSSSPFCFIFSYFFFFLQRRQG